MIYAFERFSGNSKTGPIPVTISSRDTCPTSCKFKGNGCYADSGRLRLHWDRVSRGENKSPLTLDQLALKIKSLPEGQLWRHNQAGDLPGSGDLIDTEALLKLIKANKGKRGFTYTHKPVRENLSLLVKANEEGFTVNASANSLAEADQYVALGLPTVVVVPEGTPNVFRSPAGHTVRVCLEQQGKVESCFSCQGFCQRRFKNLPGGGKTNRDIIAFVAHGHGKKKLLKTLDIQT